jgi:predicted MFS family arabinose efflux permease
MTFYPLFAVGQFQIDPSVISSVFSAMYFSAMIVRIFAVSKTDSRRDEKKLIVVALILSATVALMPLSGGLGLSAVMMALVGISHGIIFPVGAMIINSSTLPQERGTANSIFILMINLNSTVGPVAMGFVAQAWGITLVFPILATVSVIGLVSSRYIPSVLQNQP